MPAVIASKAKCFSVLEALTIYALSATARVGEALAQYEAYHIAYMAKTPEASLNMNNTLYMILYVER